MLIFPNGTVVDFERGRMEFDEGRIIAEFDPETNTVTGVEDWNGNEASERWWIIAQERLDDAKFSE